MGIQKSARGAQTRKQRATETPPLEPTTEQHEAPILTRRLLLHPDVVRGLAVTRPFNQQALLEIDLGPGDVRRDLESTHASADAE